MPNFRCLLPVNGSEASQRRIREPEFDSVDVQIDSLSDSERAGSMPSNSARRCIQEFRREESNGGASDRKSSAITITELEGPPEQYGFALSL